MAQDGVPAECKRRGPPTTTPLDVRMADGVHTEVDRMKAAGEDAIRDSPAIEA